MLRKFDDLKQVLIKSDPGLSIQNRSAKSRFDPDRQRRSQHEWPGQRQQKQTGGDINSRFTACLRSARESRWQDQVARVQCIQ